jgi:hypothetical protein
MKINTRKFYLSILILIISILTFRCAATYASSYYVDKNASGKNNGSSWTNAWKSLSAINWSLIGPGDTLFISGGEDSLIYQEELRVIKSGTAANPIIIIAGKYSPSPGGRDGRVILDGGGTRDQSIYVRYANYVTIKGFELRHATKGVHIEDYASNIVLDSLNIYNYLGQAGIMLNGADTYTIDSTTIRNCHIVSFELYNGQTDGIYAQRCQRTLLHNNYIHQRNQDPNAHTDALQAYLTNGWVIYNNFFINDSVYSPEGGGIPIILGSEGNNPVIIYNNFLYMGGIWWPSGNIGAALCTRWYDNEPMPPTWIIHNTIVVNGPRCRGVWLQYPATTVNNIIAMFSPVGGIECISVYDLPSAAIVDSLRNNLFWSDWAEPGFSGQFRGNGVTGNVTGWTDWRSIFGGTGMNSDPLFLRNFGFEPDQGALNGELKTRSPAMNKGEDAQDLINRLNAGYNLEGDWKLKWEDIKGFQRNNTPTIGAYE